MSPSTRPSTQAKTLNAHSGAAAPKRKRRTREEIEAAKEAEKLVKKKQETTNRKKLANVAQAADDVVLEAYSQAAAEPRVRPRKHSVVQQPMGQQPTGQQPTGQQPVGQQPAGKPLKRTYAMLNVIEANGPPVGQQPAKPLKRTYAMLNVTEANQENYSASDADEQSDNYAPSEAPTSEPIIDPASDSDTHAEPPQKKKGKAKKASILQGVQAHHQHLDPILEEHDEGREEEMIGVILSDVGELPRRSHAVELPFKAG